jgi:hypothetical protein
MDFNDVMHGMVPDRTVKESIEVELPDSIDEPFLNPWAITYSRGKNRYDNHPQQRQAADFDAFADAVLNDRAEQKGQFYVCAPFAKGPHNDPEKKPGDDTWRLAHLAQPRFFLPFDFDGFDEPGTYARLLDWLKRYQGFAYTTASHKPDSPRCRAVLALTRATDREEGQRLGKAVQTLIEADFGAGPIKFDESVYRAEQPLYTPLYEAESVRFAGMPVDVDEVLSAFITTVDDWDSPPKPTPAERAARAQGDDSVFANLQTLGMLKRELAPGKYAVECPFSAEHSSETGDTSTVYYLPSYGGYKTGGFHCLHAHCRGRAQAEFRAALGLEAVDNDQALQNALAIIDKALADAQDDPGALATPAFYDAVRLVRDTAPEEWARVRCRIKSEKPQGVRLDDIDAATRPFREEDGPDSVAAELIALALDGGELFYDEQSEGKYIAVNIEGVEQVFQIGTKGFIEWLSYAYYATTANPDKGKPGLSASEAAIKQACFALAGIAKHEGEKMPVYLRAAPYQDGLIIFIGDDRWQVIDVQPTGWRVLQKSPVKFWKTGSMQALPIPHPGGDIEELWQFANIQEQDRPLVLAWMLEAFRPETPFPVLALNGLQGSAKTSTHTRLRQLLDPNKANLRAAPKTIEDIYVSAGVNWIVSFENISHLTPQQQDALCTLATGGGFASRTLYTNAEETIIEVKRPVIINSIPVVVTAQDLTDRALNVELKQIDYREESEINAAFKEAMPRIFGALLDLLVKTLAQMPKVKLTKPPRMADFTRLGEAMMQAQGHQPGAFEALFRANRQESVLRAMESSPVAVAVREMVDEHEGQSTTVFHGTMKRLLEALSFSHRTGEGWPRYPRGLGDALKRQSPALAAVGIEIETGKQVQRIDGERGLIVTIRKAGNIGNIGNVV